MALPSLPTGPLFRLAARQRIRETGQKFCQASAYLPARLAAHIATREKQQAHPCGPTNAVCEDLSRDPADPATRRGPARGPSQRHDEAAAARRRCIPACGPRTCAYPDPASPQTSCRRFGRPPACHLVNLEREPVSALGAASLQDLAAVRRAHSLEEPVAALALAAVGLICPFHEPSLDRDKRT